MKRLAVSVVVVVVGLLAGWYYWTGSIQYSLRQIQQAIKTHDRYLFEKHVDIDNLLDRMVDDLIQQRGIREDTALLAGVVSEWKEKSVRQWKKELLRNVESAGPSSAPPEENLEGVVAGGAGVVESLPALLLSKPRIKRSGHSAILEVSGRVEGVEVSQQEKSLLNIKGDRMAIPFSVQLRFVQTPSRYWKLTEIANLTDILDARTKAAVDVMVKEVMASPAEEARVSEEEKARLEAQRRLEEAKQAYRSEIEKRLNGITEGAETRYLKTMASSGVVTLSGRTTVSLSLVLAKDGRVKSVSIKSTPENEALRQEIEQALHTAEPLDPFPEALTEDEFSMWFSTTFDL